MYGFSHTRTNLVYSANSDILLTFCSQNKSFFLNNGFSVIDNGAENTNKMQIQHQQVTTSKMKLSNGVPCIIDRYITNEYQILFTYYFASVKINCPSDANY